jgi:hypothetical protein
MSLIDAAFWTKIVLRIALIAVVFVVGGYYGFVIITWTNPDPKKIFEPAYGCEVVLPEPSITDVYDIDLTKIQVAVETAASAIQTTTTGISKFPPLVYVYRLDISGQNFGTAKQATEISKALKFPQIDPARPSSTQYAWRDDILGRSLLIDTSTLNFDYTHDLNRLPRIPNLNLPSIPLAPSIATTFLATVGLSNRDFTEGKTFAYPVNITKRQDGTEVISEARSLQEASLVRVDFQKATVALQYDKSKINQFGQQGKVNFIDFLDTTKFNIQEENLVRYTFPRVAQTPVVGNVQVYLQALKKAENQDTAYRMVFRNWVLEPIPCGTYPIIEAADALRLIKEGKGKVVYLTERGGDRIQKRTLPPVTEVNVFTVELAYLETFERQEYLQPIYVAEGEVTFNDGRVGNIGIYIPAIASFGE